MLTGRAFQTEKGLGLPFHLLILTALCLITCLIGCSDGTLVSESATTVDDGTSFFDLPFDETALAKRTDIVVDDFVVVEQFLAVDEGGVILLSPADDLELAEAFIVQPESFPADTVFLIQVTKIIMDDGELPVIYDFGPDGLEFTKPALLRINAWADFGKKATSVVLYWLNEDTGLWEKQGVADVDPETGNTVLELQHFSKYGTSAQGKSSNM